MDVVWVLAAVVILLTALGVAIWLVELARRMSKAVESAQASARTLEGLTVALMALMPDQPPGKRRADPDAEPPTIQRETDALWADAPDDERDDPDPT